MKLFVSNIFDFKVWTRLNCHRLLRHFAVWLFVCMAGFGCASHFHNPSDAKNAADAEAKVADLASVAPQSYANMAANLELFKAEEEYLMKEVNSTAMSALVTKMPSMTWQEVFERVKNAQKTAGKFAEEIAEEAKTYKQGTDDWTKQKKEAAAAVAAAKKRLTEAKEKVAAWNKSIAVLQQAVSDLPPAFERMSKAESFQALADIASEAGAKVITYKDADGKDQTVKVRQVLEDGLDDIVKKLWEKDVHAVQPHTTVVSDKNATTGTVTKFAQRLKGLLPDAPGISVVLANLALDTAKVRLAVAEDELNYREQRAHLFEDAYSQVMLARQLMDDLMVKMGNSSGTLNNVKFPPEKKAFAVVIQKWRETKRSYVKSTETGKEDEQVKLEDDILAAENQTASLLKNLRMLAVSESIILRNRTVFHVASERLAHQHSISLSALSDQAHQALFKATMAGLRVYHDGGVKPEQVANFIRLAQAVALASIADGVN